MRNLRRKFIILAALAVALVALGGAKPPNSEVLEVVSQDVTINANASEVTCITPFFDGGPAHTGYCYNYNDANCSPVQHPLTKVFFKSVGTAQGAKTAATVMMDDNDDPPDFKTTYHRQGIVPGDGWKKVAQKGGNIGDLGDTLLTGRGSGWITVTGIGQFLILVRNTCTV